MNFDTEKPVVLRFVDLMIRAEERREREAATAPGYACSGPGGRMLYVNGVPREVKYCPSCKPLRRQPHRCKLAVGGVDPDRYWRVRAQMLARGRRIIAMKNLGKLAKILMANAEDHPYRGSTTPLCDFRGSWGNYVIEYYHRAKDGMTVLTVKSTGAPVEPLAMADIRNAFGVPPSITPDRDAEQPRPREDGTYIDTLRWRVPQATMALL